MSDYEQQTGTLEDRLANPEVTPEEAVRPGFWGGLTPGTPAQGAASGLLETGQVLAQGVGAFLRRLPAKGSINPIGIGLSEEAMKPWERKVDEVTKTVSDSARAGAKAVMPDPRLTGSAANIVLGSSKMMTEAGALTALTGGNVVAGAAGLAGIQGVARYQDYVDQGVDPATARKLALVQGAGAGLGMVAPVGLPTSWLASLTPARALLADLATGAASNLGQGAANRYATHQILANAGYPDMAEQSKVFDGEAVLTDMLTGGGFGALHFMTSRRELAEQARELGRQQSVVADNARAAQDGQQIVERAPGVPVDVPSQASHQAALEKATSDLLADKPVDVSEVSRGTFARPAKSTQPMRDVLHDEFRKAGVLDEWSKLEDLNDLLESKYEHPPVKPQNNDIQVPDENGVARPADQALEQAKGEADEAKESGKLFQAAIECVGRSV